MIGTLPKMPALPIEDDERHSGETDAFIARNREALSRSIRHSRSEAAEGKVSKKDIGSIIVEGRTRHRKKTK
jgi:hypothetical protein